MKPRRLLRLTIVSSSRTDGATAFGSGAGSVTGFGSTVGPRVACAGGRGSRRIVAGRGGDAGRTSPRGPGGSPRQRRSPSVRASPRGPRATRRGREWVGSGSRPGSRQASSRSSIRRRRSARRTCRRTRADSQPVWRSPARSGPPLDRDDRRHRDRRRRRWPPPGDWHEHWPDGACRRGCRAGSPRRPTGTRPGEAWGWPPAVTVVSQRMASCSRRSATRAPVVVVGSIIAYLHRVRARAGRPGPHERPSERARRTQPSPLRGSAVTACRAPSRGVRTRPAPARPPLPRHPGAGGRPAPPRPCAGTP